MTGSHEVVGSTPIGSTINKPRHVVAFLLLAGVPVEMFENVWLFG
jgi:hypothetical protein